MDNQQTPNPLDERLFHRIRGTALSFEVYLQRSLKQAGITVAQFHVISLLWRGEGVTQSFIGEHTFMSEGVTSQLVKDMVAAGLLDRQVDKVDKRKRLIYLTPKSKKLNRRLLDIWEECVQSVSAGFLPETIDEFAAQATRLRLNALAAYDQKFGKNSELKGETLDLVEILQKSSNNSISVMDQNLNFVFMNEHFTNFFSVPSGHLEVGDHARKLYQHIAGAAEFKIPDAEVFITNRLRELRTLSGTKFSIRKMDNGNYFKIQQKRLADGHIVTTTEQVQDESDAKAQMAEELAQITELKNSELEMLSLLRTDLEAPIKDTKRAFEAKAKAVENEKNKEKLIAARSAFDNFFINLQKILNS